MTRIENDCCDCATPSYPCLGDRCALRNQKHYYCDDCGDETELYHFDGMELCGDCVLKRLEMVN